MSFSTLLYCIVVDSSSDIAHNIASQSRDAPISISSSTLSSSQSPPVSIQIVRPVIGSAHTFNDASSLNHSDSKLIKSKLYKLPHLTTSRLSQSQIVFQVEPIDSLIIEQAALLSHLHIQFLEPLPVPLVGLNNEETNAQSNNEFKLSVKQIQSSITQTFGSHVQLTITGLHQSSQSNESSSSSSSSSSTLSTTIDTIYNLLDSGVKNVCIPYASPIQHSLFDTKLQLLQPSNDRFTLELQFVSYELSKTQYDELTSPSPSNRANDSNSFHAEWIQKLNHCRQLLIGKNVDSKTSIQPHSSIHIQCFEAQSRQLDSFLNSKKTLNHTSLQAIKSMLTITNDWMKSLTSSQRDATHITVSTCIQSVDEMTDLHSNYKYISFTIPAYALSNGDVAQASTSSSSASTTNSIDSSTSSPSLPSSLTVASMIQTCLVTDRLDSLYSTIVCDESGVALGLVYSSSESIALSIMKRRGVYWSRSRQSIWEKGLTSGATQLLISISFDCDCDALRFTVRQNGHGFCHLNRYTCWSANDGINHLFETLENRRQHAETGSYTRRLFNDAGLLNNKIIEEANELIDAPDSDQHHIASEAADLLYFIAVRLVKSSVSWNDVMAILDQRALKVRRRAGNAKANKNDFNQVDDKFKPKTEAIVDRNGKLIVQNIELIAPHSSTNGHTSSSSSSSK